VHEFGNDLLRLRISASVNSTQQVCLVHVSQISSLPGLPTDDLKNAYDLDNCTKWI